MPTLAPTRTSRLPTAPVPAQHVQVHWHPLLTSTIGGAALGLSAPGLEQWYLAWVGLAPLLLLSRSSGSLRQAAERGLCFGMAYHLVYYQWCLGVYPLDWVGFSLFQSALFAGAGWLVMAFHQALLVSLFSVICWALPLTTSWWAAKIAGRWHLPAVWVLPLLWVVWMSRVANAHCLLGVPWSALEYSQYKLPAVLAVAPLVGGLGIGFAIALINTAVAIFIASLPFSQPRLSSLACKSVWGGVGQLVVSLMLVLLAGTIIPLFSATSDRSLDGPAIPLSIIQGCDTTDDTARGYVNPFFSLLSKCRPGLCIATETAIPVCVRWIPQIKASMSKIARGGQWDILVGCFDADSRSDKYNAAVGIKSDGTFLPNAYRKRYLIPFLEYTPTYFQSCKALLELPKAWSMTKGFASGTQPVLMDLGGTRLATLICFEVISPELAASSVKAGGQVLVDVCDIAWFHHSIVRQQMIAAAAIRAAENARYFVFASNTGPSVIIDPKGRIVRQSTFAKPEILTGQVYAKTELTAFCRWYSALGRF